MAENGKAALKKRGRVYLCTHCDYRGDKVQMTEHVMKHHVEEDLVPYHCDECDRPLRNKMQAKVHLATRHHGLLLGEAPDGFTRAGGDFRLKTEDATRLGEEASCQYYQGRTQSETATILGSPVLSNGGPTPKVMGHPAPLVDSEVPEEVMALFRARPEVMDMLTQIAREQGQGTQHKRPCEDGDGSMVVTPPTATWKRARKLSSSSDSSDSDECAVQLHAEYAPEIDGSGEDSRTGKGPTMPPTSPETSPAKQTNGESTAGAVMDPLQDGNPGELTPKAGDQETLEDAPVTVPLEEEWPGELTAKAKNQDTSEADVVTTSLEDEKATDQEFFQAEGMGNLVEDEDPRGIAQEEDFPRDMATDAVLPRQRAETPPTPGTHLFPRPRRIYDPDPQESYHPAETTGTGGEDSNQNPKPQNLTSCQRSGSNMVPLDEVRLMIEETIQAVSGAIITASSLQPIPPGQDMMQISGRLADLLTQFTQAATHMGSLTAQAGEDREWKRQLLDGTLRLNANITVLHESHLRQQKTNDRISASIIRLGEQMESSSKTMRGLVRCLLDSQKGLSNQLKIQAEAFRTTYGRVSSLGQDQENGGEATRMVGNIVGALGPQISPLRERRAPTATYTRWRPDNGPEEGQPGPSVGRAIANPSTSQLQNPRTGHQVRPTRRQETNQTNSRNGQGGHTVRQSRANQGAAAAQPRGSESNAPRDAPFMSPDHGLAQQMWQIRQRLEKGSSANKKK